METKQKDLDFTDREKEIMNCFMKGQSTKMAADELEISKWTVNFHDRSLKAKIHTHSRGETISYGFMHKKLFVIKKKKKPVKKKKKLPKVAAKKSSK